jgi:sterol O-acyltransferase
MSVTLLVVMYMLQAQFIQPWIEKGSEVSLVELVLRLMLPSTAFIILCFYLVFENMCNFFAEVTRLDSREFY